MTELIVAITFYAAILIIGLIGAYRMGYKKGRQEKIETAHAILTATEEARQLQEWPDVMCN